MRGYTSIGLHNCKDPANVGGVLRATGCYGADMVVLGGERASIALSHLKTDTRKTYRHIPTLMPSHVLEAIPYKAQIVAVDLVDDAVSLCDFQHPESAFYIFGPEDGTLENDVLARAHYKVFIPTSHCMNLAATVNVVLYDRLMKAHKS